jgi:glycosyltransferase involved in cell wall biosynthesis
VERATEYCHELIRIPFTEAPRRSARFWSELASNLVSPLPYAVAKYRSAGMRREIERLTAEGGMDVVVCDFLFPSQNVPDDLPCRSILFQHNVEAQIWQRHTEVRRGRLAYWYFREQWRRMERFEGAECRRFDRVIAVSAEDAALLERAYGLRDVGAVPTGVDTAYFHPSGEVQRVPKNLVFTGSMDWMPNEDGIRWFVDEVLPRIHASDPEVTLTVVGRNPPAPIQALATKEPRLEVTGTVPDVRPYLERASIVIVPLRVGGGTRLKVYEALAMERALVTTRIGAEGLPLEPGRHALTADTPEAFAQAILRLLADPAEAERLGKSGAELVRANYGWDGVARAFTDEMAAAVEQEPARL